MIGISFGELDVYYSKAVINDTEDNTVIKDKTHIDFNTTMTLVGEKYVMNYDVTNGSKNYDARISMNCKYETEDGGEYLSLNNIINTDDLLEAMTTRTGILTIKMIKAVTEPKDIHITCELSAKPIERDKSGGDEITKEPTTLVETILSKANDDSIQEYNAGEKGEVYAFRHEETDQLGEITDYRYIGNTPNNYITYNNELWRIIGVFEDENGIKRAKIVRNESIGKKAYGATSNFATSSIKKELDAYPSEDAYSQLDNVTYYMGSSPAPNISADRFYLNERSRKAPEGSNNYSYQGKVGLLYLSDYYYTYGLGINNSCYANATACSSSNKDAVLNSSWMYKNVYYWAMDVYTSSNVPVYHFTGEYGLSLSSANSTYEIFPVAYLKSKIIHSDGDGTEEHPYVIESVPEDTKEEETKPEITYSDKNLVKQILLKKNADDAVYNDETNGEVFTFEHETTEQEKAKKSYRYIGGDPNNYIMYDTDVYRIVGVFEDEKGVKRAKIVKNDYELGGVHNYQNYTSWTGNSSKQPYSNDFSNAYINFNKTSRIISDGNLELADSVDWYLGGYNEQTSSAEDFYKTERGTNVYNGNNTLWNGKTGIMYVSDFLYTYAKGVDDICYSNKTCKSQGNSGNPKASWMYTDYTQWLIDPFALSPAHAALIKPNGSYESLLFQNNSSNDSYYVRPTVYLKADIETISGDGTKDNPYVIENRDSRSTVSSLTNSSVSSDKVEYINFVNSEPKVPSNAIASWDASYEHDGSIMAYTLDEDANDKYELYFVKKGKIYTDRYVSNLFSFKNMIAINGIENLSTKYAESTYNMFSGASKLQHLDLSKFDMSLVTSMNHMFMGCKGLISLNVSGWDTRNVTDMVGVFDSCESLLRLDLRSWDTRNVTDIHDLFVYCYSIEEINLRGWNTSKVTNMQTVFDYCKKLKKIDISTFDTSNVTDMTNMFMYCQELEELDLSNFNTSSVKTMLFMFQNCEKLKKLNISSFNTSNVTDMSGMFANCYSLLSLNLSGFDTSKVKGMSNMFARCSSLTELDLSNFYTPNLESTNYMFEGCANLKKLNLKRFSTGRISINRNIFRDMPDDTKIIVGTDSTKNWILNLTTETIDYYGPDRPAAWNDSNISVEA